MANELLNDVDLEDLEKELEGLGEEDLDDLVLDLEDEGQAPTEDDPSEGPSDPEPPPAPKKPRGGKRKTTAPVSESKATTPSPSTTPAASSSSPFDMLQQAIAYRVSMIQSGVIQVAGGEGSKEAVVENLKWVSEFISLLNR